jgi:tetratricopeptide (TPR) repeat protein
MAQKHPGTSPEDERAIAGLALRHATALEHHHAGRHETALPLLGQVLLGCRAVLGENHPDTLTVEGNVALVCLLAGHADEGFTALREACEARDDVFGPDDPRSLTAVECLAAAHLLLGYAGEAIRLGREVAAARKRVLGATHPDTLAARLGVGLAYAEARSEAQAISVLTAALQDAEAAHGVHRLTMEIRGALACCHAVTGESATAAAEYDRAVTEATELLGPDDPVTVALREEAAELGVPQPSSAE